MLSDKLRGSWRYTSNVPTDQGRLEIGEDDGGSLTGTWTSSRTGEVRTGWGLRAGVARVIFGRSGGGFAGVVVYRLVDGQLEALWTQTAVGGAIGTGSATRVDGSDGQGFNGSWTITYVNPDGTVNPPYGLEISGEGVARSLTWIGDPAFHGVGFVVDGRLCAGWGLTTEEVEAVVYGVGAANLMGPTASTGSSSTGIEDASRE